MEIIQKFINYNRPKTPLKATGGVIHETDNPNDSDEMEQAYFNSSYVGASAHAFIDSDSITQTIPWNEKSWHAGPTANKQFWGIELCNTTDREKFKEIWNRGVWLFTYLFTQVANPKILTVTKDNLMSHSEVSKKWKETDHQDPIAYFAKFGKTVDDFRKDVQKSIDEKINSKIVDTELSKAVDKLYQAKIINTPSFWLINAVKGKMVTGEYAALLIKMSAFYVVNTSTPIETVKYALNILMKHGLDINSPEYWIDYATTDRYVDGEYMAILIKKIAAII